jgi:hypothetical protein
MLECFYGKSGEKIISKLGYGLCHSTGQVIFMVNDPTLQSYNVKYNNKNRKNSKNNSILSVVEHKRVGVHH